MSTLSRVISDPDTTAPTIPTAVGATALSSSAIRVTWFASTDSGGSGLLGYRVLRSTSSGGPFSQVSPDLSVASLAYDDTGLAASTQCFYRVVAFDGNANVSAQSTTASATTQAGAAPAAYFLNYPVMDIVVLQGSVVTGLQDTAQYPFFADHSAVVIQNFNPTLARLADRVSRFQAILALQVGQPLQTRFGLYTSYQQALKDAANDGGTQINSRLINGTDNPAEGNPNWWLRRVNGAQIEAPFNPTLFWMINIARNGLRNALNETYAQALWRKWAQLLNPSDAAHNLFGMLSFVFEDDVHARMQTPMAIGNGTTTVTDPDFEQNGVGENILDFSAAATAGSRKWCEGHIDSKAAFEAAWPGRLWFSNSSEFASDYTDGNGSPPLPMSGHPLYARLDWKLQESIDRYGLGFAAPSASAYSFNGGGGLLKACQFLAINQCFLRPDAQSPAGRNCVVAHLNTIDRVQVAADYELARFVLVLALLHERVGVSLSIGASKPLSLNEQLLEYGAPIGGVRSMGTLNESTAGFTQRTANFTSGVARFYWVETAKAIAILRGDSPTVGVYPSADAAVACTLPSPGAGYKWQRINETYTNPLTGRSMRVQQPTLNDGSDVGATVSLRPYHATVLRRVSETVNDPLEADWRSRSSGPNVVWLHDFRSAAEVNNFRWDTGYGNDPLDQHVPNSTRYRSDDGITGGCLETFRPAGNTEPPEWWRPFSPLVGTGNGRGVNDPGASGTIAAQAYAPTDGGNQIQNWGNRGFYGNAAYHSAYPGAFDGTDYWMQVRVKISASRVGQADGGKLFYFTRTDLSLTSQEIVTVSNNVVSALNPSANLLKLYRSGSPGLDSDDPGDERQPGNSMGLCHTTPTAVNTGCFFTPQDVWFTFLYHITNGTDGGNDTRVEMWVARDGETSYTKIWDQSNVDLPFGSGHPFGHNALICSGYMNGQTFSADVYHRYCQLIFSKSWIAPPQAYSTTSNALIAASASLSAGQNTSTLGGNDGTSGITAAVFGSIQWVNRFFYDHERRQAIMLGKWDANNGTPTGGRSISLYNATANTWTTSGIFHIGSTEGGHVYESFAYDPKARQVYSGRYSTTAAAIQIHTIGDPLTTWTTTSVPPWALSLTNATQAVICWHPNLFGVDDGGLIAIRLVSGTNVWLVTWRKSTNAWSTTALVASTAPSQHGAMTYVRSLDAVFATHAGGNTYRINAGAGGTAATPIQIANPPIQCRHVGGGSSGGILIDDPRGLGGPYVLAKGTGIGSVYKYEGTSWTTKAYTHPFPVTATGSGTNWVVAPAYPLGGFMCMRDSTAGPRYWEPND